MNFIHQIIENLRNIFFSGDSELSLPEKEEKTSLAIFLKFNDVFIFLDENGNDDPKDFKPLLVEINGQNFNPNNTIFQINDFMLEEFDVSPNQIQLFQTPIALYPIKSETFFCAIVDLAEQDLVELEKRDLKKYFKVIPKPYILLHSDKNMFFNALAKSNEI